MKGRSLESMGFMLCQKLVFIKMYRVGIIDLMSDETERSEQAGRVDAIKQYYLQEIDVEGVADLFTKSDDVDIFIDGLVRYDNAFK